MPEEAVIVITVGISLKTNCGKTAGKSGCRAKCCLSPKALEDAGLDSKRAAAEFVMCRVANGNLEKNLSSREQRDGNSDLLPQELSYLALWAKRNPKKTARVHLLASDTREGRFCAEIIWRTLGEHRHQAPLLERFDCVEPITIPKLGIRNSDPDAFRNEAVPNVIGHILSIVEDGLPRETELIVNPTGGFKGIISYVTLATLLAPHANVSVNYLYETSEEIISLPKYPIGLDYGLWHTEAALLEAAKKKPTYYEKQLNPKMGAVLEELIRRGDSTPGGSLAAPRSPARHLPEVLEKTYKELSGEDPLQAYAVRVIGQFLTGDFLRGILTTFLKKTGANIWLGDQLVMAADHAAWHHHDLLALAQTLLTPIADRTVNGANRPFLTEEERFVLLSALLLHDCGHTVGALPLKTGSQPNPAVPLLKSEIRDWHHWLAHYRLGDEGVRRLLGWEPPAGLLEAVRWLCVYHRRSTGWGKKGRSNDCPLLDNASAPLDFAAPHLPGKDSVDLPKLIVLLRLIDGCDNQCHRVGGGSKSTFANEAMNQAAEALRLRMGRLLPAARRACDRAFPGDNAVAELLDAAEQAHNNRDKKPKSLKTSQESGSPHRRFAETLALHTGPAEEQHVAMALWEELLAVYDAYCVSHRQEVHFIKHEAVESILILPGKDFEEETCWHFDVVLRDGATHKTELDSADFAKKHAQEMGGKTLREWIQSEIVSEIVLNSDGEDPNAMLGHLAGVSGRTWRVSFRWEGGDPFHIAESCP